MASLLQCSGCDARVPEGQWLCFSCPERGAGDVDHVLQMRASGIADAWPNTPLDANDNAFVRYRRLSYSYQQAIAQGLTDADYLGIVNDLSEAISSVDRAPRITPLAYSASQKLWIKNETINVSGSHKARHLIGTAIHLALAERLTGQRLEAPLAIASCGNAALAAAVVAKAAARRLQVFVPVSADENVLARLDALGAERVMCERRASDPGGDPCYLRFREAVALGALPFSCQGGDNALALIGGHTLGWEILDQSRAAPFANIFVQVGGGALASSVMQAFAMAKDADIIDRLPRFFAVQTDNAHPLARAWQRLQDAQGDLRYARAHRSEFMWPWESPPSSIASGILDDETYDWYSIAEGLLQSGGSVIRVSESRLQEAQTLGHQECAIAVDHTGTAGLAGLVEARSQGLLAEGEANLVLFTGAIR